MEVTALTETPASASAAGRIPTLPFPPASLAVNMGAVEGPSARTPREMEGAVSVPENTKPDPDLKNPENP